MADKSVISKMEIAVVDDHDLIREGLNAMLLGYGVGRIDKFSTAGALVDAINEGHSYDFFIVDLELPDMDGFVLIEMIRARNPVARIIVSTVHDEIWTLRKLVARDVDAIVYKSGTGSEIMMAITEILDGRHYYCEEVRRMLDMAGDASLHPSSREFEVLYQISLGKTTKEIAAALFVSENTVEAHRKALFQKMGAVNVADLVIKAVNRGYIKKGGQMR